MNFVLFMYFKMPTFVGILKSITSANGMINVLWIFMYANQIACLFRMSEVNSNSLDQHVKI